MLFWRTDLSIHGSLCTLVGTNRCKCFRHLLNSISFMSWTSGSAEASRSPLTVLRTSHIPAVGACCFPAISPPTLATNRSVCPPPHQTVGLQAIHHCHLPRVASQFDGRIPALPAAILPPGTSSPIESCYCESATGSHTPQ